MSTLLAVILALEPILAFVVLFRWIFAVEAAELTKPPPWAVELSVKLKELSATIEKSPPASIVVLSPIVVVLLLTNAMSASAFPILIAPPEPFCPYEDLFGCELVETVTLPTALTSVALIAADTV